MIEQVSVENQVSEHKCNSTSQGRPIRADGTATTISGVLPLPLDGQLTPLDWTHTLYLQPPADAEVLVNACGYAFVTSWDSVNQQWITCELSDNLVSPDALPKVTWVSSPCVTMGISGSVGSLPPSASQGLHREVNSTTFAAAGEAATVVREVDEVPWRTLKTTMHVLGHNLNHEHVSFAVRYYGEYMRVECKPAEERPPHVLAALAAPSILRESSVVGSSQGSISSSGSSVAIDVMELTVYGLARPGLVQLECWCGKLLTCRKQVAVVRESAVQRELAHYFEPPLDAAPEVQAQASSSSTHAITHQQQQSATRVTRSSHQAASTLFHKLQEELKVDDLMTDLGCWSEFMVAMRYLSRELSISMPQLLCSDKSSTIGLVKEASMQDAGVGGRGKQRMWRQLIQACLVLEYRMQMVETALQLLMHSCSRAWVATAQQLVGNLISLGLQFRDIKSKARIGNGPSLLHRSVCSNSAEMVRAVWGWGKTYGPEWTWSEASPDNGITPLHMAAVMESQQGSGVVAVGSGCQPAFMLATGSTAQASSNGSTLAEWILQEYQAACSYWHGARDSQGMTPADVAQMQSRANSQALLIDSLLDSDADVASCDGDVLLNNHEDENGLSRIDDNNGTGDDGAQVEFTSVQATTEEGRLRLDARAPHSTSDASRARAPGNIMQSGRTALSDSQSEALLSVNATNGSRHAQQSIQRASLDLLAGLCLSKQELQTPEAAMISVQHWVMQQRHMACTHFLDSPGAQSTSLGTQLDHSTHSIMQCPVHEMADVRLQPRAEFVPSPVEAQPSAPDISEALEFISPSSTGEGADTADGGSAQAYRALVSAIHQGMYMSDERTQRPDAVTGPSMADDMDKSAMMQPLLDLSVSSQEYQQRQSYHDRARFARQPQEASAMAADNSQTQENGEGAVAATVSPFKLQSTQHPTALATFNTADLHDTFMSDISDIKLLPDDLLWSRASLPSQHGVPRVLSARELLNASLFQFPDTRAEQDYLTWLQRRRQRLRDLLPCCMLAMLCSVLVQELLQKQFSALPSLILYALPWLWMVVSSKVPALQQRLKDGVADEKLWIGVVLWHLLVRSLQAANILVFAASAADFVRAGGDCISEGAMQVLFQIRTQPAALLRLLYILSGAALYIRINATGNPVTALLMSAYWNILCLIGSWIMDMLNRRAYILHLADKATPGGSAGAVVQHTSESWSSNSSPALFKPAHGFHRTSDDTAGAGRGVSVPGSIKASSAHSARHDTASGVVLATFCNIPSVNSAVATGFAKGVSKTERCR